MARPKKNTKAGKIALKKWRKTMAERYGDTSAYFAEIGRKGGQAGAGPDYTGGFAGSKDLARKAGAVGGTLSRRGYKFIKYRGSKRGVYLNLATNKEEILEFGRSINEK